MFRFRNGGGGRTTGQWSSVPPIFHHCAPSARGTHGQERCAYVRTHTRTHSLVLTGSPPPLTTLGCLPRGRFLLLLVCSSSLTAGATNLNHHFALAHKISSIRFLVSDFASSRFGLATSPDNQFPFGICPNSKHHTHTEIFAFFFTAQHSPCFLCSFLEDGLSWPPTSFWSATESMSDLLGSNLGIAPKSAKFNPRRNSSDRKAHTHTSCCCCWWSRRRHSRGPLPANRGHFVSSDLCQSRTHKQLSTFSAQHSLLCEAFPEDFGFGLVGGWPLWEQR